MSNTDNSNTGANTMNTDTNIFPETSYISWNPKLKVLWLEARIETLETRGRELHQMGEDLSGIVAEIMNYRTLLSRARKAL